LKEIFEMANDLFGAFFETFTAHEILQLRKTINQFVTTSSHMKSLLPRLSK
jgi:hypothetical protein